MAFADLMAAVDAAHEARLSDTITYPPNGGAPLTIAAYADIGERVLDFGLSGAVASDAYVEIGVDKLPSRPARDDVLVLQDSKSYRPTETRLNDDGTFYRIVLTRI